VGKEEVETKEADHLCPRSSQTRAVLVTVGVVPMQLPSETE
ncbi:unnamed protein product, partial [Ectocarpus sp. 8 AP-2014]